MANNMLIKPVWQLKKLVICNLVACVLFGLWALPATYEIFMQLDAMLFKLLNGSLFKSHTWAAFWAITSVRYFDVFVALVLGMLLICGTWLFNKNNVRQAFFALVALMVLQVVVRIIFTKLVQSSGWQHASPSLVLENVFRLSEHFPGWEESWELKDRSSRSFPGDHASVLLIWALFLTQFSRKLWHSVVIWFIALAFMLPRLVAGAHWASDDYIGGLVLALFTLGWGFYTPFAARISAFLLRITSPVFEWLRKVPVVNYFNIVHFP